MSNKKSTSLQHKAEGKYTIKNSFFQPYIINWPTLEKGENHLILDALSRFFDQHPEVKKVRSLGKRKAKDSLSPLTPSALRPYLVTGINAVTKALEREQLRLVFVCRSAKPAFITQHIISLSATRHTPAAAVSGLSTSLCQKLNFKSVLAIGFKYPSESDQDELKDLINLIQTLSSKLKPISLPWLLSDKENTVRVSPSEKRNTLIPTQICINNSISNKKQKR